VAHGAAARIEGPWRHGWERLEVGDEWGSEPSGPQVLVGRTLWWASEEKIRKMRRLGCQATRPKLDWAAMRNRKGFQILIQRNEIQI
jgi:hypothetical protein